MELENASENKIPNTGESQANALEKSVGDGSETTAERAASPILCKKKKRLPLIKSISLRTT
ncbi:MAG: hypothetical protein K2O39_04880, partial [Clostridiales bacterium]|nr:hypothetical protein [Clostridiales bacterium]